MAASKIVSVSRKQAQTPQVPVHFYPAGTFGDLDLIFME